MNFCGEQLIKMYTYHPDFGQKLSKNVENYFSKFTFKNLSATFRSV
jgi:hypothetical protein